MSDQEVPDLTKDIEFSQNTKLNIFRYLTILSLVFSSVKQGRKCDDSYLYKLLYYLEHHGGLALGYRYDFNEKGVSSKDIDYDILALSSTTLLSKEWDKDHWIYTTNETSLGYLQNYPTSVKIISEVIRDYAKVIKDMPLSKINREVKLLYFKVKSNNLKQVNI